MEMRFLIYAKNKPLELTIYCAFNAIMSEKGNIMQNAMLKGSQAETKSFYHVLVVHHNARHFSAFFPGKTISTGSG